MSSTMSSHYSYNYILKSLYSTNKSAAKSVYRPSFSNNDLVTADSSALKNATDNLSDIEYNSDNATEIYRYTKAFVATYNNLISSSKNTSSTSIKKEIKDLKNYISDNSMKLSNIGITFKASGELDLDPDTFLDSKPAAVARVFSSKKSSFMNSIGNFSNNIYKLASKIHTTTNKHRSSASSTSSTSSADSATSATSTGSSAASGTSNSNTLSALSSLSSLNAAVALTNSTTGNTTILNSTSSDNTSTIDIIL